MTQKRAKPMDDKQPSQTALDGHDPRGRFTPGNRCSKGNSVARKAARCRDKLFNTISVADFQAIVKTLVGLAKGGEGWAVKLLFSYLLGDPQPFDFVERLKSLEQTLSENQK
jgi:hypothetical protein